MRSARSNHQLMQVIRFLTGLNDQFVVVKSQILLMDPLPNMNKIFSMVIQHERQLQLPISNDESQTLINVVDSKKYGARNNTFRHGTRVCTFCGKNNHTVENCFKKHGVPPHMQKQFQNSANNVASYGNDDGSSSNGADIKSDNSPMTQGQFNTLMELIQKSSIGQSSGCASSNQVAVGHLSTGNTSHCMHSSSNSSWIINSGASDHICSSIKWFHSYKKIVPISVRLPNGQCLVASYSGTIHFFPDFIVHNVLLLPEFSLNLLSVSRLCESSNYNVSFLNSKCFIQDKVTLRMTGSAEQKDGLYYLTLRDNASPAIAATITLPEKSLWHFRLGHLSNNRLLYLHSQFPFITVNHKDVCDVCSYARQRKLSYTISNNRVAHPYDLIHFDIWGPLAVQSLHGHSYFLTVVDDCSRFTWITLMKAKSEARQHVKIFVSLIENQHQFSVKIIRTDNGAEFHIPEFYASKGIIHQTSCVESPQQNGKVERKHQHLLNVGRALLFQSKLPKKFWSYAILHATFIINKLPTQTLNNLSPYFILHNEHPDMHSLKVFGSLAFASSLNMHRSKLDSRARKCVFLGYKNGMKGVVLYDINNHTILVSRNVIHHEHIFPYSNTNSISWDYHIHKESIDSPQYVPSQNIEPIIEEHDHHNTIANDTLYHSNTDPEIVENTNENHDLQHMPDTENCKTQSRPVRTKQTPHYLSDYVCNTSDVSAAKSSSGTSKVIYPISNYDSLHFLSASHRAFASNITLIHEPKTYKEVCLSEHWTKAMKTELDALVKNRTWNIVDFPPHVKPIGNIWCTK